MYREDSKDYVKYKRKITRLMKTQNMDYLTKELIWRPNIVFGLLGRNKKRKSSQVYVVPYLAFKKENVKMGELLFGALLHYANDILGINETGETFLTDYLNYNELEGICDCDCFVKFSFIIVFFLRYKCFLARFWCEFV